MPAFTASSSRTSATRGGAWPPAFSISLAAVELVPSSFGRGVSVLAAMAMLAPSRAARSAIASPMPRDAPVMNSILPLSDMVLIRLFDDFVGADHDCVRHRQAERSRAFQIERQQDFGRLFDRQVCGLGPVQNLSDEIAGPTVVFLPRHPIAQKTAGRREFGGGADHWDPMLQRQRGDPGAQIQR